MSGTFTSFSRNRLAPGTNEYETLTRPNDGSHVGRRGVIFCHGYTGSSAQAIDFANLPGDAKLVRELAKRGLCVVSGDFAGDSFGNDTAMARVALARTYLTAQGCATDKVLFIADSMGNWLASRYAADNPGQVAAILGIEPGSDLNDVRDNNRASAQAAINTAWGLTAGSTSATLALPTRANLLTRATGGALAGLPFRAYYSTADTTVLPSTVTALVNAIGSTADMRAVPGTPAHGAGVSSAVPVTEAADWLAAFA